MVLELSRPAPLQLPSAELAAHKKISKATNILIARRPVDGHGKDDHAEEDLYR